MQHAIDDIESWIGRDLVGSDGDKIGTIKDAPSAKPDGRERLTPTFPAAP